MERIHLFSTLGISVLLGLLVGLQRERGANGQPGVRTFPLITLLGTVTAVLSVRLESAWAVAAGMLGVTAVLLISHSIRLRQFDRDLGTTTDMAALVMYAVGALLVVAPWEIAIAVGAAVAVLLQFKPELHGFVEKLGDADLRAIMQFVLITCIILPVLPNRTYGPLAVFNPFETWLMVVLIVGMSLGGYIIYKFLGRDAGILLGGLLGGAISSTATTVSYARLARSDQASARVAAIVILVASTVVFGRVLLEIGVVAPQFLLRAYGPIVVLMLLVAIPAVVMWFRVRRHASQLPPQTNPTQLKSAIVFAATYAAVLFALAASQRYLPREATYAVAAVSGLTDMDAVTLSTARLSRTDPAVLRDGWRLIVVGACANLVFKAALAGLLGSRGLLRHLATLFTLPLVGGIAMVLFWP